MTSLRRILFPNNPAGFCIYRPRKLIQKQKKGYTSSFSLHSTFTIMPLITRLSHQAVRPAVYLCTSHRCASVLSSLPPKPIEAHAQPQHSQGHIVTPATLPLTAASNNAFHPDYIPKAVKARLTLDELKQVLDTSKTLLNHLQSEYLEHQMLQETMVELTKEQQELLKTLRKNGSNNGGSSDKS